MPRLKSGQEFYKWRDKVKARRQSAARTVTICGGAACTALGSGEVYTLLQNKIKERKLEDIVGLKKTGCHGFCERGPVMVILPEKIFYPHVQPEDVSEILDVTLQKGEVIDRLLYVDPASGKKIAYEHEVPFYARQQRVVFRHNGVIDPCDIEDYVRLDGYSAFAKAVIEFKPEQVIEEVKKAGLRGRGGAGFPTGLKWEFCRKSQGEEKYVICNADEGDPGAYMDRSLLEGNPHSVIEGMMIGGYAMGATQSIIYCRAEYPLAVQNAKHAIEQARECGLIGKGILGTDFDFEIIVRTGAGAFVCGEETALIASLEDRPGEPRPKPPFPAQGGLWGKPTNINNVESWANVPLIINNGSQWYRSTGTEKCTGTKIFSLVGKISNTGLVEAPMGITLRELIFDIGGGPFPGRKIKAVQIGGPSGGCIPAHLLDLPVDYESLTEAGAIMGSGGVIVMDDRTCMVDIAKFFLEFLQDESCGKCVPCREGIPRMLGILTRITEGEGREGDIELLEEIGTTVKKASLCGLGQTAANPLISSLRYFREEYEAHIKQKRCSAAVCKKIISSPCQHVCPLGTDVPAYVTLIGKHKYLEAAQVIAKTNPLSNVCARVCHHPCERFCSCGEAGDPIAIRPLKRFAMDCAVDAGQWPPAEQPKGQRSESVAVVGSGPAGLTAAFYLALEGCQVTVFEAENQVGGALATAIPEYRLPRDVLDRDLQRIKNLGVTFRTGVQIGVDISFEQIQSDFEAIYLAVGTKKNLRLGISGEEGTDVHDPITFLKRAKQGGIEKPGDFVVIIGGGNVAVDVARTSLRLGSQHVLILYRRTVQEMPADKGEVEEALQEGIKIEFLASPVRILRENGRVTGVMCRRMKLDGMDKRGRRKPVPLEGEDFEISADTVIPAIGQTLEDSIVANIFEELVDKRHLLTADAETASTSIPGVFAGGDAVTGAATVTEAMASGKRGAESILQHIRGEAVRRWHSVTRPTVDVDPIELSDKELDELLEQRRPEALLLPCNQRKTCFDEVELKMAESDAVKEAKRCLRCDRQD